MKGYHHESRSVSSCAACKYLKRKCTLTCIFAPYFPSDELSKFAKVHKVFGASNVSKILSDVPNDQRADAVHTLVYEAEARLRDPVYGCIGAMALLQDKMLQLQHDLAIVRSHIARYATININHHHTHLLPTYNVVNNEYISGGAVPLVDYEGAHGMRIENSGSSSSCCNPNFSELEQFGSFSSSSFGTFFQS